MIIAITGASGVGKTATLEYVSSLDLLGTKVFHFDDIGMPNWDEIDDHQEWQRLTTEKWIGRLVKIANEESIDILFEGSTSIPNFIRAFNKNDFSDYKIILLDCDQMTMETRLMKRHQPELYTQDMINWLHHLRNDAISRGIEIIRTDGVAIGEVGNVVIERLKVYR